MKQDITTAINRWPFARKCRKAKVTSRDDLAAAPAEKIVFPPAPLAHFYRNTVRSWRLQTLP